MINKNITCAVPKIPKNFGNAFFSSRLSPRAFDSFVYNIKIHLKINKFHAR